eukprot:299032-Pyramimonas_sp.AAC.1
MSTASCGTVAERFGTLRPPPRLSLAPPRPLLLPAPWHSRPQQTPAQVGQARLHRSHPQRKRPGG